MVKRIIHIIKCDPRLYNTNKFTFVYNNTIIIINSLNDNYNGKTNGSAEDNT